MFFSRRLDYSELTELCRSMRFALTSGMMLRDVMDLLSRDGPRRVRPVASAIAKELRAGWSLEDAMNKQEVTLPRLFISLATVGEATGNLPEVLHELEKYYRTQQQLRHEFIGQITSPILQFIAAIFIVAALIWVLGMLPKIDDKRQDPIGLGLIGERGALTFLGLVGGVVVILLILFELIKLFLGKYAVIERVLLALPAIGPFLRAIAIARLCLAARLMLDTSLSIVKSLRLAFLATNNPAFSSKLPEVESSLKKGDSVTESFKRTKMFPEKFIGAISVGEESGRLPETFRHQGEEYEGEAQRRLTWLTRMAGNLIWVGIAAFIIYCIITIFKNTYGKAFEGAENIMKSRQ